MIASNVTTFYDIGDTADQGGQKAYILSKGTDLAYSREVGILFEEEDLMIGMFVGRGFSEEELTQILKGARIVRYTEGDRNYKPTGYGNWIVEQR